MKHFEVILDYDKVKLDAIVVQAETITEALQSVSSYSYDTLFIREITQPNPIVTDNAITTKDIYR